MTELPGSRWSIAACAIALVLVGASQPESSAVTATAQPALATSAPAATQGVDVSEDQGEIDWAKVKASGIEFAYAKATGGLTVNDGMFARNWAGIAVAGLLRGAYHFYYAGDPPVEQVAHFLRVADSLGSGDLPPMVDIEPESLVERPDMDPSVLQRNLFTFLETLEARTGRRPVIYTDPSFARRYLTDPKLVRYPLWIAEYGVEGPTTAQSWRGVGWTIWQYSESGTVKGIDGRVDRDVYRGTREQLTGLP